MHYCEGHEYQTMAETKMLKNLGADIVGMSTVLEAIAFTSTSSTCFRFKRSD